MKKRHAATHIKRSVRYPGRRQFIRHAACNITRSGTQSHTHTHTHKIVRFSQFAGEQVCLPTCVRRGVIRPYKGLPLSRVHCKSCSSLSAHTFFKILRCREMGFKCGRRWMCLACLPPAACLHTTSWATIQGFLGWTENVNHNIVSLSFRDVSNYLV